MTTLKTTITDQVTNEKMNVTIVVGDHGIEIQPEGYDCKTGGDAPIYLEPYNGEMKAYVWSDINQEEPTHFISLEGAKKEKLKEEQHNG